jgi:hypothetical protein
MASEHHRTESDEEGYEWWWLDERFHPSHGLDREELRQHHELWLRIRAEWQERETAGTLDAEARHALIERLGASLPGEYTGPFSAVSGVVVGIVERLLSEDLDYNPLVEWEQIIAALHCTVDRMRRVGINISVEVDPKNEFGEADDGSKVYADFNIGFFMEDDEDGDLLTVKEAAQELDISPQTLHNHIQRKRGTPAAVPVFKVGRQYVLYRREFEKWKKAHYRGKFAPKQRRGYTGKRGPRKRKDPDDS